MSWQCICTVARLKRFSPMRMVSKIRIGGALMLLAEKKSGKSSANGPGTCVWNWAINLLLSRCVLPSLLLLSRLHKKRRPHRLLLLNKDMDQQLWPCRGRAGRFSGQDFALQRDGTLRCPAGQSLVMHER